ncbi:MAG: DUF6626 family protein [Rhodospirillaceae bacterium]
MAELSEALFLVINEMRRIGYGVSDNRFSELMLAKSKRYVSWLRASNHSPGIEAMVNLYVRLDQMGDGYKLAGDIAAVNEIEVITDHLWNSIREASLSSSPNRRSDRRHDGDGRQGELAL